MEERGGAGQHKGAGSCGLALGRWRITGWGGGSTRGSKGGHGCGGEWGLVGEKPESHKARTGAGVERWGEEGGCEGETAQHKKAYSWSGLFLGGGGTLQNEQPSLLNILTFSLRL